MPDQPTTLPDIVDDDAPFVQHSRSQCRECGALEPDWTLCEERRDKQVWDVKHQDETGHSQFYFYTYGRHTSQLWKH